MTDKHHKEEDEVIIDFSKIKKWFSNTEKKGEKHHAEHNLEHHEHNHEKAVEADQEDGSVNFNWSDVGGFFKKYATIFLILIPLLLTIYLRIQPMQLPATDDWAQNAVYNYYQQQITTQVNQQYPNLPAANKQTLINSEFQKLLEQNKAVVEQQLEQTSQGFKEQMMYESGDSKYVYLGDIDSYYWLREARKIEENGRNCDEIDYDNQLCYQDTYSMAPTKSAIPLGKESASPYVHSIIIVHKMGRLFNKDMTLMQASFYTPLIYALISVILAFLLGKVIAGNLGGFIVSMFITFNPIYLARTTGSDNDPQSILYPLLIMLLFVYTFKSVNWKKRLVFGTLTGAAIGLFSWAWTGWWFMLGFIIGTLVLYGGFIFIKNLLQDRDLKKFVKNHDLRVTGLLVVMIVLSTGIFVSLFSSPSIFFGVINQILWFTQTKVASLDTFWPNVLVTVAEFNPGSIASIISQMGGKLIYFLGLIGILFLMYPKKDAEKSQKYLFVFGLLIYLLLASDIGAGLGKYTYFLLLALPVIIGMLLMLKSKTDIDVKTAILLVIWFIATTYAALKGIRFTLLMIPAFGIALGITFSRSYEMISEWLHTGLKINKNIAKTIIILGIILLMLGTFRAGVAASKQFIPNVNDAWYDSLTKIKAESNPDAIINSWWDFGHWFKYIADRRVTLDGGSQSGPPLHWLGKLMVTDDEQQSVGILRMLDCGSNKAFDELNKIINDTSKSIAILDEIVKYDKQQARETLLSNDLTEKQADAVLQYTHCNPPENFFITSEDMVGKSGVWAHFGSWDFTRAEMYTRVKGKTLEEGKKILMSEEYNLSDQDAEQYYYEIQTQEDNNWITPWPNYLSGVEACQPVTAEATVYCEINSAMGQLIPFQIDLKDMNVTIPSSDVKPASIVYITPTGTAEKKFEGKLVDISIVLIPSNGGYSALLTNPQLANSMFTRLFYLEGHGLKYFDRFDDKRGVTGGRIIVWKVDWDGTNRTIQYQPIVVDDTTTEDTVAKQTSKSKSTKTTAEPVQEAEQDAAQ